MKNQRGFTLVEIAIVLVIIGIILGAALKGQQLIYNAKVKRVQSQIKEMMAAVYTYYDKYGYYPGDDPTAKKRWNKAKNGNGNGYIDGGYCGNGYPRESCFVWQHLRYADIISGDPNDKNPASLTPKHAFGGPIDVFSYTTRGKRGLWVALQNLEGEAAEILDRTMDDGKCDTGSVIAYSGTCSGGKYDAAGNYALWVKF